MHYYLFACFGLVFVFFFCFGVIPGEAQDLLLMLQPVITPGGSGDLIECQELNPGQLLVRQEHYPLYYHSSLNIHFFVLGLFHHVFKAMTYVITLISSLSLLFC